MPVLCPFRACIPPVQLVVLTLVECDALNNIEELKKENEMLISLIYQVLGNKNEQNTHEQNNYPPA